VVQEAWGRIERVAPGVWALFSTPLQDRKTLANGAIIDGRDRVVVVEALGSNEGERWLLEWAEKLAEHPVDDVFVTHYHGDHTAGLAALAAAAQRKPIQLHATQATLDLIRADDVRRNRPAEADRTKILDSANVISGTEPLKLELGGRGRTMRIVPRAGHTASDLSVELDDPSIVVTGDLVWNHMFPNYVDATPSVLKRSVRGLTRERETLYVPGHGALANAGDLAQYVEVLDLVEAAARAAHQRGVSAADVAKEFKLPASLGEWTLFSPRYYEVALGAWEKELTKG
jgi:glyoxylase-like metal-dependent hydrolase (beta-lactamase superfamily II)